MQPDKRNIWNYRGCVIVPIDCQPQPYGKVAEYEEFGDGRVRRRYWRVEFPDGTWIKCGTKEDCREYIDLPRNDHRGLTE